MVSPARRIVIDISAKQSLYAVVGRLTNQQVNGIFIAKSLVGQATQQGHRGHDFDRSAKKDLLTPLLVADQSTSERNSLAFQKVKQHAPRGRFYNSLVGQATQQGQRG